VITRPIDVGAGDIISIEIAMAPTPFALDSIVVEAERGPVVTGTLVDAFHERRYWLGEKLGLGTFITREKLESRNAVNVSDVLRTLPSVRLTRNPETGGWDVVLGTSSFGPGKGCRVAKVYVDGVWANRFGDRSPADNDIDLIAIPDLLEGIEVYRGAAQMPPEFGGSAAQCGVVALWTKRGR
jgi:outer membrane cobalamin receptor